MVGFGGSEAGDPHNHGGQSEGCQSLAVVITVQVRKLDSSHGVRNLIIALIQGLEIFFFDCFIVRLHIIYYWSNAIVQSSHRIFNKTRLFEFGWRRHAIDDIVDLLVRYDLLLWRFRLSIIGIHAKRYYFVLVTTWGFFYWIEDGLESLGGCYGFDLDKPIGRR